MSDGQILKPDKDFYKEVDKQLPEAEQLAKVKQLRPSTPQIETNGIRVIDKCSRSDREAHCSRKTNQTSECSNIPTSGSPLTASVGIGSRINISDSRCNSHHQQRFWRLEFVE